MTSWNQLLLQFYTHLQPPKLLPNNIEWLYPQQQPEVITVLASFLDKFYNDTNPRQLILGINPGRFGAGVTGVNFTAPLQLTEACGIEHPFKMQSEISAEFIYRVIEAFGGVERFYGQYFVSSVCPLGFVQNKVNLNYYDDKELLQHVEPFILESLQKQLSFPFRREKCICIGGEKNFRYLNKLNEEHRWFQEIIPLPHPRFIMQYKRKQLSDYIQLYLSALEK